MPLTRADPLLASLATTTNASARSPRAVNLKLKVRPLGGDRRGVASQETHNTAAHAPLLGVGQRPAASGRPGLVLAEPPCHAEQTSHRVPACFRMRSGSRWTVLSVPTSGVRLLTSRRHPVTTSWERILSKALRVVRWPFVVFRFAAADRTHACTNTSLCVRSIFVRLIVRRCHLCSCRDDIRFESEAIVAPTVLFDGGGIGVKPDTPGHRSEPTCHPRENGEPARMTSSHEQRDDIMGGRRLRVSANSDQPRCILRHWSTVRDVQTRRGFGR